MESSLKKTVISLTEKKLKKTFRMSFSLVKHLFFDKFNAPFVRRFPVKSLDITSYPMTSHP